MIDIVVGGLRDCVFFLVVAYLGLRHALSEPILAALLSAYTAHRFGISMGKQQAVIALNNAGPNVGGGGGTVSGIGTVHTIDPQGVQHIDTTRQSRPSAIPIVPTPVPEGAAPATLPPPPADRLHLDTGAYRTVSNTLGGIG